jgi:hypothetical protein
MNRINKSNNYNFEISKNQDDKDRDENDKSRKGKGTNFIPESEIKDTEINMRGPAQNVIEIFQLIYTFFQVIITFIL